MSKTMLSDRRYNRVLRQWVLGELSKGGMVNCCLLDLSRSTLDVAMDIAAILDEIRAIAKGYSDDGDTPNGR